MNCTVACAKPEGRAIYPDTFAAVRRLLSKRAENEVVSGSGDSERAAL